MDEYYVLFCALLLATAFLQWPGGVKEDKPTFPIGFLSFRRNYLLVYSLMMGADWLQGPYVYALYQHYGYSQGDIGKLFIAGFGSSMVVGTVVGALADTHGRKRACLAYCATYALSCATKHYADYSVLLAGRLLGGVATSLLFSAFESWLVSEHNRRGYDPAWLGGTFGSAVFLGNGVMAILAGLLANQLVGGLGLGPVAPFDASACVLVVGGALIAITWTENYGQARWTTERACSAAGDGARAAAAPSGRGKDKREDVGDGPASLSDQFRVALGTLKNDPRVGLLGAIQSLFEASMYTFVFLWTPALSPAGEDIPHGLIFATFMVSCMLGSSIAGRLQARPGARPERYMQVVFLVAAASLAVPVATSALLPPPPEALPGGPMGAVGAVNYLAFNVFEVCVGIFWPSLMKMRSQYVPENVRSTVLNLFRLPLNLFVCVILYNVSRFPLAAMFGMCAAFLALAAAAQRRLDIITERMIVRSPSVQMEMLPSAGKKDDSSR